MLLCFSPCGNTLASGSIDNTIKIWDTVTFNKIDVLIENPGYVNSVCFQPNNMIIYLYF